MLRRWACVSAAALAVSCGGDSGPSTTPAPPRPAPLIPLAWANVPSHISVPVGGSRQIRLTLTATVSARHTIESDHSRVTITSDRINGGVFTATVRGSVAGRDTVRLTASATGYQTAEASFTVSVERPRPPPPRPIPNDPRFERTFWRQLVFNGYECPHAGSCADYYADGRPSPAVESRFVRVLPTTSPNFYIRTHDDAGRRTFSGYEISTIRGAIPGFVETLTGSRYRGEIVEGSEHFEAHGWITIAQVSALGAEWCGRAGIGWLAGFIELNRDVGGCSFTALLGHEIGHAMGFWHVPGYLHDLMYPEDVGGPSRFSGREAFHAQLAYRLGRGHPYTDGSLTTTDTRRPESEAATDRIVVCHGPIH